MQSVPTIFNKEKLNKPSPPDFARTLQTTPKYPRNHLDRGHSNRFNDMPPGYMYDETVRSYSSSGTQEKQPTSGKFRTPNSYNLENRAVDLNRPLIEYINGSSTSRNQPTNVQIDNSQTAQLMCYWCSINIAQEDAIVSSGPNHMPTRFNDGVDPNAIPGKIHSSILQSSGTIRPPTVQKLEPIHRKILNGNNFRNYMKHSSINQAKSKSSEKILNNNNLPSNEPGRISKKSKPRVMKLIPSLLRQETIHPNDNPLFDKFNHIFTDNNGNRKSVKESQQPFFDQVTSRTPNRHSTRVHPAVIEGSSLSNMLSSSYPHYLNELSSVHHLYPSSRSSHRRTLPKIDSSAKLLRSHPLNTYFSSVDPLLDKEIHFFQPDDSSSEKSFSVPVEGRTDAEDASKLNSQVEKSLLLDAWWRLRLYLHVGHTQPWL